MISDPSITEFQRLWKQHYGEGLSREKAEEYGDRLVRLVKALIDVEMHKTPVQDSIKPDAKKRTYSGSKEK